MTSVGFTGTHAGMSAAQKRAFIDVLDRAPYTEFHHGDCIGADAEAHGLVRSGGPCVVHVHPPTNPSSRAFCSGDVAHPPKPYLVRDCDIVTASDRIIAAPFTAEARQPRSGTWYTVRRARDAGKPVTVVWPDGRVEELPAKGSR